MRCLFLSKSLSLKLTAFTCLLIAPVCAQNTGQAAPTKVTANPGDVNVQVSRVYTFVDKTGFGHPHAIEGKLVSGSLLLGAESSAGQLVFDMRSFDADTPAFYYARVFENPSCRWSQYTCNAAGVDCSDPASVPQGLVACCEESHQASIQERAWTSPIWYTPN